MCNCNKRVRCARRERARRTRWVMDLRLLALPVVGGLIGWFTNYLAVKMLFRPREPVRLPGFTLQGMIPRRRAELARSVGRVIEREFISHEDVRAVMSDRDFLLSLRPRVEEQVDAFLRRRVVGDNVLLRAAFSMGAVKKLKERVVDDLMDSLPEMVDELTDALKDRLRFRELVEAKIEAFELERLEDIVRKVAKRELKAIELFGGVIGFTIGLIQMGILTLLG